MSEEIDIIEDNSEEVVETNDKEVMETDNKEVCETSKEEICYIQAPEIPAEDNNAYSGEPVANSSGKGTGIGLGIASLVLGIVSLLGCCGIWYISIPCAFVAAVLGIVQCVKNEAKGMAIAGIICGVCGFILTVTVLILFAVLIESGLYYELMSQPL